MKIQFARFIVVLLLSLAQPLSACCVSAVYIFRKNSVPEILISCTLDTQITFIKGKRSMAFADCLHWTQLFGRPIPHYEKNKAPKVDFTAVGTRPVPMQTCHLIELVTTDVGPGQEFIMLDCS